METRSDCDIHILLVIYEGLCMQLSFQNGVQQIKQYTVTPK